MFAIGNLVMAIATIVDVILTIMYWLILIRALLSWVSPDPFNPIVKFLYTTTEPILQPIRRLMPRMAFDLSPIIAFLAILFFRQFVVQTLVDLAHRLR